MLRERQTEAINQRVQSIQNTAKQFAETHVDNDDCSSFERCILCDECLNNVDGPEPNSICSDNCADVVQVHPDVPHRFHRGCILQWCNASDVNVTDQMGTNDMFGDYHRSQQGKNKCPICRINMNCEALRTQPKVSNDLLSTAVGGSKRRKTRKGRKKSRRRTRKNVRKNRHKHH